MVQAPSNWTQLKDWQLHSEPVAISDQFSKTVPYTAFGCDKGFSDRLNPSCPGTDMAGESNRVVNKQSWPMVLHGHCGTELEARTAP